MDNDLLPCPFCGGDPKLNTDGVTYIMCTDCGMIVNNQERGIIKIKEQWNTRANEWELKPLNISDYLE